MRPLDTSVPVAHHQTFKRAVEGALPRMRFLPAAMNGCYIKTWVQQEFLFTHAP